ncbi:MAG TPA: hypothetical protein VI540_09575, partial [Gaiellaceae bacterium]|nr:hypothetical protein [Gaiellaceae bacterium]
MRTGRGRELQHCLGVQCRLRVVREPGEILVRDGASRQNNERASVELEAARGTKRVGDGQPCQLVPELDSAVRRENAGRKALVERDEPLLSRELLEQPELGPWRDHGHRFHERLRLGAQTCDTSQDRIADRPRNRSAASGG